MATLVAFIGLLISVIATFRYWWRGWLTFGLPDVASGIVAVLGVVVIGGSMLALQADIQRAPERALAARNGWYVLLLVLLEVAALGALAAFYIWVCERGGAGLLSFP